MRNYKHQIIRLETLSYLSISPRTEQIFYKGIDFEEGKVPKEVQMIYPFYQYGTYERYDPSSAQYYIPGSSLKGALLNNQVLKDKLHLDEKDVRRKVIIDDLEIISSDSKQLAFEIKDLWKYQYLHDKKEDPKREGDEKNGVPEKKKAKYDSFFPNVGFEMLKPGQKILGNIYYDPSVNMEEIIEQGNIRTKDKLSKLKSYIEEIKKKIEGDNKEIVNKMDQHISCIEQLLQGQKKLISLGGYKGLIRSLYEEIQDDTEKGGIFIDNESRLPYGIVALSFKS